MVELFPKIKEIKIPNWFKFFAFVLIISVDLSIDLSINITCIILMWNCHSGFAFLYFVILWKIYIWGQIIFELYPASSWGGYDATNLN